jgi:hypothetical protein
MMWLRSTFLWDLSPLTRCLFKVIVFAFVHLLLRLGMAITKDFPVAHLKEKNILLLPQCAMIAHTSDGQCYKYDDAFPYLLIK